MLGICENFVKETAPRVSEGEERKEEGKRAAENWTKKRTGIFWRVVHEVYMRICIGGCREGHGKEETRAD